MDQSTNQMTVAKMLSSPDALQCLESFALQMSKGKSTLPKHLQGSQADCMAIVMQAAQWGMNPFAVAQKTHLVNGLLGYEAQLVNAVVSSSRAIQGRFKYEWEGEGPKLSARAGAVLSGESDVTWGAWVKSEDQSVKNSPLWKTDPAQQLAYLAVKKWARLYTPDVILGVYTPEELEGRPAPEKDMGEVYIVDNEMDAAGLTEKLRGVSNVHEAPDETLTPEPTETEQPTWDFESLIKALGNCENKDRLQELRDIANTIKADLSKDQQAQLRDMIKSAGEGVG